MAPMSETRLLFHSWEGTQAAVIGSNASAWNIGTNNAMQLPGACDMSREKCHEILCSKAGGMGEG